MPEVRNNRTDTVPEMERLSGVDAPAPVGAVPTTASGGSPPHESYPPGAIAHYLHSGGGGGNPPPGGYGSGYYPPPPQSKDLKKVIGYVVSAVMLAGGASGTAWFTKAEVDEAAVAERVEKRIESVVDARIEARQDVLIRAAVDRVHLEDAAKGVQLKNDMANIQRDLGSLQSDMKDMKRSQDKIVEKMVDYLGERDQPPRRRTYRQPQPVEPH